MRILRTSFAQLPGEARRLFLFVLRYRRIVAFLSKTLDDPVEAVCLKRGRALAERSWRGSSFDAPLRPRAELQTPKQKKPAHQSRLDLTFLSGLTDCNTIQEVHDGSADASSGALNRNDCCNSKATDSSRKHDPIHGNCTIFVAGEILDLIQHCVFLTRTWVAFVDRAAP
jgi:hypothetical protein